MNEDRLRKSPNVGIIGSSSLLGKELMEMIEQGAFPLGKLITLETEEYVGLLQEFVGDIQITQIISPASLEDVDIAFFACSPEIMTSYLASGAAFPDLTIDLTQSGPPGQLFLSGISDPVLLGIRGYFINPSPAAIPMARTLYRLHSTLGVKDATVTVIEPASEWGSSGIDELQAQTVSLLNFQPIEYKVFGGQLSFNLRQSEDRISQQLTDLPGRTFPVPMISAVQAPVFHSHGFSVFVEFSKNVEPADVRAALSGDSAFVVYDEHTEGPTPVGVAGSNGIHVGRIRGFESRPAVIELWLVADNLRLAALNAIRTAENIMLATIGR